MGSRSVPELSWTLSSLSTSTTTERLFLWELNTIRSNFHASEILSNTQVHRDSRNESVGICSQLTKSAIAIVSESLQTNITKLTGHQNDLSLEPLDQESFEPCLLALLPNPLTNGPGYHS